jgi:hypothetical protein
MNTEIIITSVVVISLLSAILLAIKKPKNDTLTVKIERSEEETPNVDEVVKPKRKYKKRVSKKKAMTTTPVAKKPIGRPRKTVE